MAKLAVNATACVAHKSSKVKAYVEGPALETIHTPLIAVLHGPLSQQLQVPRIFLLFRHGDKEFASL